MDFIVAGTVDFVNKAAVICGILAVALFIIISRYKGVPASKIVKVLLLSVFVIIIFVLGVLLVRKVTTPQDDDFPGLSNALAQIAKHSGDLFDNAHWYGKPMNNVVVSAGALRTDFDKWPSPSRSEVERSHCPYLLDLVRQYVSDKYELRVVVFIEGDPQWPDAFSGIPISVACN